MNKLTKEQLDSIKNAKTKDDARKAYMVIQKPAYEKYKEITDPVYKKYKEIQEPAWEAYLNWKPTQNYSNMTREKLIAELEKRDNE